MYGDIQKYAEYVWKCERMGNVYGNIKKYKEYVWKHKEIYREYAWKYNGTYYGICMEI